MRVLTCRRGRCAARPRFPTTISPHCEFALSGRQQKTRQRFGHQPDQSAARRAPGSYRRNPDPGAGYRSRHRPRRLSSGASGGGRRLQRHHAKLPRRVGQRDYLTPMILGGLATVLAAAWSFSGWESRKPAKPRWIRSTPWGGESAGPSGIRAVGHRGGDRSILAAQRARATSGDEDAMDVTTLNVTAHRLQNLFRSPGDAGARGASRRHLLTATSAMSFGNSSDAR